MRWFTAGKIELTLYDSSNAETIKEPVQVKVYRGNNLVGTYVIKDGKLVLKSVPRIEEKELDIYYRYKLEITSKTYKPHVIECDFDKHIKKINLDIVLEPKGPEHKTRIY